jgi:hypothetical protein
VGRLGVEQALLGDSPCQCQDGGGSVLLPPHLGDALVGGSEQRAQCDVVKRPARLKAGAQLVAAGEVICGQGKEKWVSISSGGTLRFVWNRTVLKALSRSDRTVRF